MSEEEIIPTDNETIIKRIEQQKKAVIEQLHINPNVKTACTKSGVQSTSTFYKWCKEDLIFKDEAYWARQSTIADRLDAIEDSIYTQAVGVKDKDGNYTIKPNFIAGFGQAKAYGNQSDLRQWSDAPPPLVIESNDDKDKLPLDTSSSAVQDLMKQFVIDVGKADQKSKSIEGETIDTKQAQDK